jgi:serine phosphatase RsbU (regulator of sigma subunit)
LVNVYRRAHGTEAPPFTGSRFSVSEPVPYAISIVAVAAVYVASGKLGLDLAFTTGSVTAIWPPTGIALAALVLGGYRMWPAVALGALLTNINTGINAGTILGITLGNTLEALVGAYLLLDVIGFRPTLERVGDVLALVAFGAVISTMVSATIGVTSLVIGGSVDFADIPSVWRTWWLGDMGGDLIVAPAVLVAATHWPYNKAPGRPLEAVALVLSLAGLSVWLFTLETTLVYLVFPLLIWAALRFWQPGAAAGSLLVATIAVTFTAHGRGPFAASGPDERLLLAQTLVAVAGTTSLVLAALTSQHVRAERAMRELAATLQESLLPARLPKVPKIETAAYFRPAGAGHRVGGDFYDLFQAGHGGWSLVIGDVVGKGPAAAALTGLARYTLRTAAETQGQPSRVLAALNDAVLREHSNTALCTAVYAKLDVSGSPRMTVSSGGHPLPLVLHTDGRVEQLGTPGTLLGVLAEPTLTDEDIELRPGETVLFYTDGLIDAYAPRRVLEMTELESLLRSCVGRTPTQIIEEIDRTLLHFPRAEPRDDIAMVVLQVSPSPP